jgi:hypothetical protein
MRRRTEGRATAKNDADGIREDRSTARLSGASIAPATNPVTAFAAVSLLFGTLIILATPPLRGPDETAHFLRAYGVALGDIVPSSRDAEGRKGVDALPGSKATSHAKGSHRNLGGFVSGRCRGVRCAAYGGPHREGKEP